MQITKADAVNVSLWLLLCGFFVCSADLHRGVDQLLNALMQDLSNIWPLQPDIRQPSINARHRIARPGAFASEQPCLTNLERLGIFACRSTDTAGAVFVLMITMKVPTEPLGSLFGCAKLRILTRLLKPLCRQWSIIIRHVVHYARMQCAFRLDIVVCNMHDLAHGSFFRRKSAA